MGDSVGEMDAVDWQDLYGQIQMMATAAHMFGNHDRERATLDVLHIMDRMSA